MIKSMDKLFWDKELNVISFEQSRQLAKDPNYVSVRETDVAGGQVLSVWWGSDQRSHSIDNDGREPLIFGTIFREIGGEYYDEVYTPNLEACPAEHQNQVSKRRC